MDVVSLEWAVVVIVERDGTDDREGIERVAVGERAEAVVKVLAAGLAALDADRL